MSRASLSPKESVSPPVPPGIWETCPPVRQQALIALLTACVLKQMTPLTSQSAQPEVRHESPPRR